MARTPEEKAATTRAWLATVEAISRDRMFSDRDFSNRTIEALVARGIDAPERLLFATEKELKAIPGIGRVGLGEIMRYRQRFLDDR